MLVVEVGVRRLVRGVVRVMKTGMVVMRCTHQECFQAVKRLKRAVMERQAKRMTLRDSSTCSKWVGK